MNVTKTTYPWDGNDKACSRSSRLLQEGLVWFGLVWFWFGGLVGE